MKNSALKRIISMAAALLIALCCLCLPATTASADNTAVEDAQYGVVRVICIIAKSSTGYSLGLGTGFAVGQLDDDAEIIITNNHVVEHNVNEIYVTITDLEGRQPAEVIYRDPNHDIAVLELKDPIDERHPLPLLSPEELIKSQDVYCLGFPGNMDDFSDRGAEISSTISDLTITKGTVSNPEYSTSGTECVLTDCAINHGNSGGPMVDEYGQVVGINTWGLDENMNCAVSINYVMEVLDDLDLEYVVGSADGKSTSSSGSGSDNGKIYAIIGAVAVVAVAGIVIARSKKKQPVYAQAQPQPQPVAPAYRPVQPVQPVQSVQTVQQPIQPIHQPVQPIQPAQRKLYLICEKGALAGQKFSTLGGTVRIGRDASRCQLVFPQGTPGVSKLHCEVRFSGGLIYITDLGSSYGTFLSNGTKLTPNVPVQVREGERFCLASQDTVISLSIR